MAGADDLLRLPFGSVSSASTGDHLAAEIEFLDAARSAPAAARLKSEIPRLLDVQPADLILEVGPGTGDDLRAMVDSAPGAFGIGVELNEGLAAECKRRSGNRDDIAMLIGDVRHLPLREGSTSCVHVERVLQHVPDMEASIAELRRVCRSQARLLILEPDQALRAVDHPDAAIEALLRQRAASQYANPTAGRRLFALLVESAFENIVITGVVRGRAVISCAHGGRIV